jgi:GT2 family glycosyltransferase
MPIAGEPGHEVIATLQGLERQTSQSWTLVVVLENAWRSSFTALCAVSGLRRSSQRLRIVASDAPVDRAEMFIMAVAAAAQAPVALLFPGDIWAPTAAATLGRTLQRADVAYADEDQMDGEGRLHSPRLKPTFSAEFLLHAFYTGRPMAFSAEVAGRLSDTLKVAPPTDAFEHDLMLRATELASSVVHVPEVLCHRVDPADRRNEEGAGTQHVVAALARRGDNADVALSPPSRGFRISRRIPDGLSVSLIIPFRDEPKFLRACVDSIDATTTGLDVELILVDNGSEQPETETLLTRLSARPRTRIVTDARPFNWAALNNVAAEQARGDVLVFLNNDIEAPQPGWLEALCAQAVRPDVGVVGARLLYPDQRVQHCGVVLGLGGAAGHLFVGLPEGEPGYLGMARTTRECAGVTGACLATRRSVFDRLEGFDESLGVDLNDIDYCLRAQLMGLRVIYEPEAELLHYESPSRGTAGDVRDIVHFLDRWSATLAEGDPFLNPQLTRVDSSCALRDPGEGDWWQQWRSNLSRTA